MVHSRLPVPSLLGLLGALLMLSLELPGGLPVNVPSDFVYLTFDDPGVQKVIFFALDKYNHDFRPDYPKYFRMTQLLRVQSRRLIADRDRYVFKLVLVETTCPKQAGVKRTFIQMCRKLARNPERQTCDFDVAIVEPPIILGLTHMSCV
ncbi:cystatin-1-like [Erythrolamprus reginae]|uniref:cystatin-1-like n=1 Tax=Erythrolamprus reginae TaxID=121349 RepID=UPI00396CADFC